MKMIFNLRILFASSLLLFSSCNNDDIEPTSGTTSGSNSGYHISFDFDGSSIVMQDGINNWQKSVSIADNSFGVDSIQIHPGAKIANYDPQLVSTASSAEITFRNNEFPIDTYPSDKAAVWSSIFTIENHPFMLIENYWGANGIQIIVKDSNNTNWFSSNQNQFATASFEVTESVASFNNSGTPIRLVRGTFSGVVLSDGSSTKTIDNGSFYLPYGF